VDALVPAEKMLPGFPEVYVDDVVAAQIRNGRNFPASPFRSQQAARYVKAVTREGELVAIGEAVLPNLYHPAVVL
jgi:tRNA pseudouridine55 synthase